MSKAIWKAVLEPRDAQEIEMPTGAEILCAREQHDRICIWFRCDPSVRRERRTIGIVGTGHDAPNGKYIGTASLRDGEFIFHVFEL